MRARKRERERERSLEPVTMKISEANFEMRSTQKEEEEEKRSNARKVLGGKGS